MKASDLFIKALENEKVKFIFGLPGEENIDLLDSISRSNIRFILTRHEQGAAFMADAYGRLTRTPGVCLSTLGPGATNLLTGVANAHLDKVPLVAITGQASRERLHKESHQNVDNIKLFSGITKYNQPVIVPDTIPEIVRKAFNMSVQEQPGATHIQISEDIAASDILKHDILATTEISKSFADPIDIQKSASLINSAINPIILAGNGVVRGEAWVELNRFVDITGIPLVSTFMAKGILPFEHPKNLFSVGGTPYPEGMRPLNSADLVIAIGFDLVEYDPVTWNADGKKKIVNIHTYPAESDKHFQASFDLVGNINGTIMNLEKKIQKRESTEMYDEIRKRLIAEMTSYKNEFEVLPRKIMNVLTEQLNENTILISDVGLHKVWVSRWYHPKKPGCTIIYNGFASMGASLPAAIASKLVFPDHEVISVGGDGGFLMNIQEMETANRLKLDFIYIVFNDGRYSLIEKKQRDMGFKPEYISFTNPDFDLLAQSFKANYFRVDKEEQFYDLFAQARNKKGVSLIEVVLNPMEN
ncbi:MAG: acetolactate synthase large subunit [Thermoplasmataceae archaeon]